MEHVLHLVGDPADGTGEIETILKANGIQNILDIINLQRSVVSTLTYKEGREKIELSKGHQTRLVILEAKGGNSQLGSRMHNGRRVEQGSTKYVQSVVENMQKAYNKAVEAGNASPEIKALGKTLKAFSKYSDKIEFRKVQQGFQTGSSLKPTFDVTDYTIGKIKL